MVVHYLSLQKCVCHFNSVNLNEKYLVVNQDKLQTKCSGICMNIKRHRSHYNIWTPLDKTGFEMKSISISISWNVHENITYW